MELCGISAGMECVCKQEIWRFKTGGLVKVWWGWNRAVPCCPGAPSPLRSAPHRRLVTHPPPGSSRPAVLSSELPCWWSNYQLFFYNGSFKKNKQTTATNKKKQNKKPRAPKPGCTAPEQSRRVELEGGAPPRDSLDLDWGGQPPPKTTPPPLRGSWRIKPKLYSTWFLWRSENLPAETWMRGKRKLNERTWAETGQRRKNYNNELKTK